MIPAHDEAAVIGRCLDRLLESAADGEFEVVVVANGCRDATAELARHHAPAALVLECPNASKAGALNAGDGAALVFPRIYLDADVQVGTDALRAVVRTLQAGALVAAPTLAVPCEDRPWLVRAWYGIWLALPYAADGLIGSGFYGLSLGGRSRFGHFPDTMADDLYVRGLFARRERVVVAGHAMVVDAPYTVAGLLAARGRVAQVNRAERTLCGAARSELRGAHRRALVRLAGQRRQLAPLAGYLAVELAAHSRARFWARRPGRPIWRRDTTARARAESAPVVAAATAVAPGRTARTPGA